MQPNFNWSEMPSDLPSFVFVCQKVKRFSNSSDGILRFNSKLSPTPLNTTSSERDPNRENALNSFIFTTVSITYRVINKIPRHRYVFIRRGTCCTLFMYFIFINIPRRLFRSVCSAFAISLFAFTSFFKSLFI